MDVSVEPGTDPAIVEAVRLSAVRAGVGATSRDAAIDSAWWRAGIEDALGRAPLVVAAAPYDATPSPRRTRGATRA